MKTQDELQRLEEIINELVELVSDKPTFGITEESIIKTKTRYAQAPFWRHHWDGLD